MTSDRDRKKVLFICTHNSARSQMAEGFLRFLYGDKFTAYSAGTEPSSVNPYAVEVMSEIGIDISGQRSKHIDEYKDTQFDYVITVCDGARESCPFFPGKKVLHKSFPDPSAAAGSRDEILSVFRQVRDMISDWAEEAFSKDSRKILD